MFRMRSRPGRVVDARRLHARCGASAEPSKLDASLMGKQIYSTTYMRTRRKCGSWPFPRPQRWRVGWAARDVARIRCRVGARERPRGRFHEIAGQPLNFTDSLQFQGCNFRDDF